jgi:hypothetical protein
MNLTVMGNEGALLHTVRDCSDLRKNELGIAKLPSEIGAESMGSAERCRLCWLSD